MGMEAQGGGRRASDGLRMRIRAGAGALAALVVLGAAAAAVSSTQAQAHPQSVVAPTAGPGEVANVHGAAPPRNDDRSTAPAVGAMPGGPPDMAALLAIADEVSSDGRYVRIGDVAISASPVVTRSP